MVLFLRLRDRSFGIAFALSICRSLADDRFRLDWLDDLDGILCTKNRVLNFRKNFLFKQMTLTA